MAFESVDTCFSLKNVCSSLFSWRRQSGNNSDIYHLCNNTYYLKDFLLAYAYENGWSIK